ncbi:unnamed protein product [Didymodactylos carnosus]|uniref:Mediator of RNA polymerase II transcription subunit 27 n=1 Tax=Didymodactylos carnosus TaxID=1234261 RepID=A0A8S2GE85_9BILA|nr:unnamed protein product [Didymodactylos carnosus]CAF3505039.1 unnamed protein product [Didymodactylos carnosus]
MPNVPNLQPGVGIPPGMAVVGPAAGGANLLARQAQNDEIISRCLQNINKIRENLNVVLNTTTQAALADFDDNNLNSSTTNQTQTTTGGTNATAQPTSNNVPPTRTQRLFDQKLCEMSTSLDHLGNLIEQYDFKALHQFNPLVNHLNELSFEKNGQLINEWSNNWKWVSKLNETQNILSQNLTVQPYRRTLQKQYQQQQGRSTRYDQPLATASTTAALEKAVQQFEQQQQQTCTIQMTRLSEHLTIIRVTITRANIEVYLYIRSTIEHVTVKPLNEKKNGLSSSSTSKLSSAFSSPSSYIVLDLIAGHIRAAAIYYSNTTNASPEGIIKKVLDYILKYVNLYHGKCVVCQKHLLNGLQPTWRDFKTYEPYHEECVNY